jgi:hypothetical protein
MEHPERTATDTKDVMDCICTDKPNPTCWQYEHHREHAGGPGAFSQEAFDSTNAGFSAEQDNDIHSMMLAIFNERCPGIRFDERDVPLYRRAAIAALNVLGMLNRE